MEDLGLATEAAKFHGKQRSEPPKHSYTYIRQKRKDRRHRRAVSSMRTEYKNDRQENQPEQHVVQPPTPEKFKLLNHLPPHMIIPPGTNVSVPPPPLPFLPAPPPLMRFPLGPLLFKPPSMLSCNAALAELPTPDNEKSVAGYPSSPCLDGLQRIKITIPPPPLCYPMAIRNPAFLDIPQVACQREFSRIFAEHTIKAALGMSPSSTVQMKNC